MNVDFNISVVLAHTVLLEAKALYSPDGIVDDAVAGDPPAPSPQESTANSMQALVASIPQYFQNIIPQLTPYAQAQAAAQTAVSPQLAQLQADIYQQTAPQLAATAQGIDQSNKVAGAQGDLATIQGPGGQAALALEDVSKQLDPEFYATRSATGNSIGQLLQSGLTPAEEEAVARSVAKSNVSAGWDSIPSATSTVSNAMQFGNAARTRQLQGVEAATSFLPQSRSNFDPSQIALGRPSINTGDSKFTGVQAPDSAVASSTENMFNQIAGFQNNATNVNANRRNWMDMVNQGVSSL